MLKKLSRAGLAALLCGLVFAAFISVAAVDVSFAQATAPAAEVPAAAAAAPPACDAKTLKDCTPNSGDTAWMLTSVALVLMMTVPGLGLFYGGMVRKKNVADTVMTSFAITCLITVLWMVVNYSTAFTEGTAFIGGLSRAFLQGIKSDIAKQIGNPNPLAPTIPETVYMCFQMTFAIITPALIAGAFAERMKFSAMLWFIGLWAIFVYGPVAHWVWGPDGFLNSSNDAAWTKVLDFAGGTVVHVNSGVAGLMCALVLGPRKDTAPAHNVVLTFIGASLLWVGWFGFNAGSAVSAGMQAGMAMAVTQIATAAAALAWMFFEWGHRGKATLIGVCSGAVAGLVAITPASGFVGPVGALVIGIAAGVICYMAVTWLKAACGYDDALDCFGVHAVGGAAGAILTGVFAISEYGGTAGWIEGNGLQVINQIKGVVVVAAYDALVSLILLKLVDMAIGLRVSREIEVEGLDINLHGETVQ
ncbi:MAG TPA: ammonium transporter [Xanthobacteraceae bacterium]|jgi:Amt family ammonium transporter|nr:ammonium transporter [Xanthobacteraceae bacterium]